MGGILVRDKNFWFIKYPKQCKLPSKHFGSPSLNFKIGSTNLRSLNPFHMDGFGNPCQVKCKNLWMYAYTCKFFFWEDDWQLLLDWVHA